MFNEGKAQPTSDASKRTGRFPGRKLLPIGLLALLLLAAGIGLLLRGRSDVWSIRQNSPEAVIQKVDQAIYGSLQSRNGYRLDPAAQNFWLGEDLLLHILHVEAADSTENAEYRDYYDLYYVTKTDGKWQFSVFNKSGTHPYDGLHNKRTFGNSVSRIGAYTVIVLKMPHENAAVFDLISDNLGSTPLRLDCETVGQAPEANAAWAYPEFIPRSELSSGVKSSISNAYAPIGTSYCMFAIPDMPDDYVLYIGDREVTAAELCAHLDLGSDHAVPFGEMLQALIS